MAITQRTTFFLARVVPRMARPSFPRGVTTTAAIGNNVEMRLNSENVKAVFRSMAMQDDDMRNDLSYSLAFGHDEESADAWQFQVLSDPRMQSQLEKSRGQCLPKTIMAKHVDHEPLPKTMDDALAPTRRAIVITENKAPFRIWNVNTAWEQLCGYSFLESRGKTLGSLLQGKETDTIAATNLISKMLQGEEEVGTELINYTKNGRRFTNRIRVGPIFDDHHKVTHFVGVLQEMHA